MLLLSRSVSICHLPTLARYVFPSPLCVQYKFPSLLSYSLKCLLVPLNVQPFKGSTFGDQSQIHVGKARKKNMPFKCSVQCDTSFTLNVFHEKNSLSFYTSGAVCSATLETVEYLTHWSFVIATRHALDQCTSGSKCAVVLFLPLGVLWPASNNNTTHFSKLILAAKEMPQKYQCG